MERSIKFLVYLYVSLVFRRQIVYVTTGMRRSGNHAFINWFLCSLEGEKSCFKELDTQSGDISVSSTNKTIFFNEVNYHGVRDFIRSIREVRTYVDNVSFVIISMEDYIPEKICPYIPMKSRKISITRSLLNLTSSRLHRAQNQAKVGLCRGDMRIDPVFLSGVEWISKSSSYGWNVWDYDAWVKDDNQYRKRFLGEFQLTFNYSPSMSTQGGGSSFTLGDTMPSYQDAITRWERIDFPERILELLLNYQSDSLLTKADKKIIKMLSEKKC